jgi:hypothetical protein
MLAVADIPAHLLKSELKGYRIRNSCAAELDGSGRQWVKLKTRRERVEEKSTSFRQRAAH